MELGFYRKVNSGEIITISNIVGDVEVKIKDWFARLVSGSIDEVGSEVSIGKECFYIILVE